MKKLLSKKKLILKSKQPKRRFRFIKDKAINDFLLQHLTPVKIDFSTVKNCLLNKFMEKENIFDQLFPETKSEINMESKSNLSSLKNKANF